MTEPDNPRKLLDSLLVDRFAILRPIFDDLTDADFEHLSPDSLVNAAPPDRKLLMHVFASILYEKLDASSQSHFAPANCCRLELRERKNPLPTVDSTGCLVGLQRRIVSSRLESGNPNQTSARDLTAYLESIAIPFDKIEGVDLHECGLNNEDLDFITMLVKRISPAKNLLLNLRLNHFNGEIFFKFVQQMLDQNIRMDISLLPFTTTQNVKYWDMLASHDNFHLLTFIPEQYLEHNTWVVLFEGKNTEWLAQVKDNHLKHYGRR